MSFWLIGYVAIVGIAMAIATAQSIFCLDASAWASWVQAIGSIVGIGIAIYVPWRQQQNQIVERRRADLVHRLFMARRLQAVVSEVVLAAMHLHHDVQTFGAVGGPHGFSFDLSSLTVLSDASRRIEEQDQEFDAGPLTLSIRTQLKEMARKVESHLGRSSHALDSDFIAEAVGWVNRAKAFESAAAGIVASAETALSR
ncbi:hypothetical protein K2O51_23165 [Cupriavidus pinatubonensis]|uniref:hypothetical protein n=1 Tax=Cupriavidus pinatubonensis TaxID=248026 RepID=UPI001C73D09D|nr:hypothetical protein [Cupriavidus pinatubonensis]QYY30274.1 hypothetical protein K2O51_23165 [Cupriavidus pinatubonensis]